jgi:hypothetical protein
VVDDGFAVTCGMVVPAGVGAAVEVAKGSTSA